MLGIGLDEVDCVGEAVLLGALAADRQHVAR